MGAQLIGDRYGRALRDLRISLTDRCNLRCVYCMPREVFGADHVFLPADRLLSFDQIERVARVAVAGGVVKLRLTGGEPLLRPAITDLVARLSHLRTPDGGHVEIALTTNGTGLARLAGPLREAGLDRVTVSLDSLDPQAFARISDTKIPLTRVLDGIAAARTAGLPVKVNTVVRRGFNDDDIEFIAEHFRGTGVTVRFIEYMDVGATNGWRLDDVVPSAEVIERIGRRHPLEAVAERGAATASRWRYVDGLGEIGVISSVTEPFCGSCTRARISADGHLFTCLFASAGVDLKPAIEEGDEAVARALFGTWRSRDDRYSELRGAETAADNGRGRVEMSFIGG
ncbi:GTP 3',8-cyclase MoaA [Rathayibacter sp. KR2-224]|uniref:GTP 3',8-cyclase MoaA n=1 Tax=Rathayibacter sp. KR2-224 TaxID=3400913 RepID=UPI003C03547E